MKKIIIILLCGIFVSSAYGANSTLNDSATTGSTLGESVVTKYGTQQGFKNSFSDPLSGTGKQLTTINGANNFGSSLSCPNAQNFMDILIQPGTDGAITNMQIHIDTTFTGQSYNFQYIMPYTTGDDTTNINKISGVCINGVVSCDSGWQNCKYYKWVAEPALLKKASSDEVTGCYCIDNSCKNPNSFYSYAFSNPGKVLPVLGAGIIRAIELAAQGTVISKVSEAISNPDGTTHITYAGQSNSSCTSSAASPTGSTTLNKYASPAAYGDMRVAGDTLALNQLADPNSYYSGLNMLNNKKIAANTGVSLQPCSITNDYAITKNKTENSGSGDATICTNQQVWMRIHKNTTNNTLELQALDADGHNNWSSAHFLCGSGESYFPQPPLTSDGWHLIKSIPYDFSSDNISSYEISLTNIHQILNYGGYSLPDFCTQNNGSFVFKSSLSFTDASAFDIPFQVSFCGLGPGPNQQYMAFHYEWKTKTIGCVYSLASPDDCKILDNNPDCVLFYEEQDGVVTVNRRSQTFATTTNVIEKTITDGTCSKKFITAPGGFWTKKRQYTCLQAPTDFNITSGGQRQKTVASSVVMNNNIISYSDVSNNATTTNTVDVSNLVASQTPVSSCEMACKVGKNRYDTVVGGGGQSQNYKTQGTIANTYDYYYKICQKGNNGYTCPVDLTQGEIVVPILDSNGIPQDCNCPVNNGSFSTAIVGLQALRLAGKDFICTGGN